MTPTALPNHPAPGSARVWRFADCEFDEARRELRVRGHVVPVEDKPLEVLRQLLLRGGEVVTKSELLDTVWPGIMVVDGSLATAISKLRKALGDEDQIIVTRPRIGYRMGVPAELTPDVARLGMPPQPAKPATPREQHLGARAPAQRIRPAVIVAAALLALMIGAAVVRFLPAAAPPAAASAPLRIASLAVLPLANLSGDAGQEYLADGVTEALIAELSKIRALRVISRTSIMRYKQTSKPLPVIARELNVDAVVEGSIVRAGDRIRVTAQLIHGATDSHLWADSYDRDLSDILNLQREVARRIADKISVTVQPSEQRQMAAASRVDTRAHELYLRGRFFWNRRTGPDLLKAVEYFEQAAAAAPTYALAYAGLADARLDLVGFGHVQTSEGMPAATSAARHALALDDSLAEAHAALAYANLADWKWTAALEEFQRALDLNPGYVPGLYQYAFTLSLLGRHDQAASIAGRAAAADPLSPVVRYRTGRVFYHGRDYARAREQFHRIAELNPRDPLALYGLGLVAWAEGNLDEASSYLRQQDFEKGLDTIAVLAASGRSAEARRQLAERIRELRRANSYVRPGWVAQVYAALGDKDEALRWLERGFAERDSWLTLLKVWPAFDPIRSDSRFQRLLGQMNFPE